MSSPAKEPKGAMSVGAMGDLEALRELHNLTLDDKTENTLLRSRLDEQSQLICILKRRADEALRRCQALEAVNAELEGLQEDAAGQLQREVRRAEILERRFDDLASNHQQIIQFKDEYKRQNEALRQECAQLRQENEALFSPALQERDARVQQLAAEVARLEDKMASLTRQSAGKIADLQGREEELLEKQRQREAYHTQELQALKGELQRAEENLQQADTRRRSLEEGRTAAESHREMLNAKKEELLQLSMQRGKVIQDRQRELGQLQERLQAAEQGRRAAEERYQQEAAEVDANLKVQELRRQLEEAEEEQGGLRKEFEAFKRHSADLLAKERELNAKLRHLIG